MIRDKSNKGILLRMDFGEVFQGWLPVKISCNNVVESFIASNVPFNPVIMLVDSLYSALCGFGGETWWHTKPAGYYLLIEQKDKKYRLILDFSMDSSDYNRENIFDIIGNKQEIIVPIWRSIRNLQSKRYDTFKVSDVKLEKIATMIQIA